MIIAPARIADWLRDRLRLTFTEEVPVGVLLDLRFDLMIEVPEMANQALRIGYRCPAFIVTDAMSIPGDLPGCLLELTPAPRTSRQHECHLTTFRTLADEAAQYLNRDGTPRDWRDQVVRLRFYHPLHQAKGRRTFKNPRYRPMPIVHVSTIWDAVPKTLQKEDDGTMDDYLRRADLAFDEVFGEALPETGT